MEIPLEISFIYTCSSAVPRQDTSFISKNRKQDFSDYEFHAPIYTGGERLIFDINEQSGRKKINWNVKTILKQINNKKYWLYITQVCQQT